MMPRFGRIAAGAVCVAAFSAVAVAEAPPAHAQDIVICLVKPSLVYPGPMRTLQSTATVECDGKVSRMTMTVCVQASVHPTLGVWRDLACNSNGVASGYRQGPVPAAAPGCLAAMWYRTRVLAGQWNHEAHASVTKWSLPRQVTCLTGLLGPA